MHAETKYSRVFTRREVCYNPYIWALRFHQSQNTMEDKLITYFSKFRKLSEPEKEAIRADMRIEKVEKGTVLLRGGQVPLDNYFVLKGCVRKFYLKGGEEKTIHFFTEEDWILPAIDPSSSQQGSDYFLECTEDSFLVFANDRDGNELLKKYPKFQELSMIVLEKEITKLQSQMALYHNNTPEQRYLHLQEVQPDLLERVPQYQLSSYIGVKPESLSRIRKRILDSEKT